MANFYGDLAHQVENDADSEISDVDSAELAKMVEDVNDLDAGLFGSASNKKQGDKFTSKTSVKSALKTSSAGDSASKTQKSHVTFDSPTSTSHKTSGSKKSFDFGDFDADDPLGDLLSDDEDDFGTKKKKKSSVVESNSFEPSGKQDQSSESGENKNKQNKAKVIAELFGLEDEKKDTKPVENIKHDFVVSPTVNTKPSEIVKPPVRTSEQGASEKIAPKKSPLSRRGSGRKPGADDDEGGDILSGLGLEAEKQQSIGRQSKSKLDELLGKSPSSNPDSAPRTILDDLLGKNPSSMEKLAAGDGKRNTSVQSQQSQQSTSNVSFGSYSPSVSVPGRRQGGRRGSGTPTLPDPLGIFTPTSSPSKEVRAQQSVTSNPSSKAVDWLGIGDTNMQSSSPIVTSESPEKHQRMSAGDQSLPDWLGGAGTVVIEPSVPPPQTAPVPVKPPVVPPQTPASIPVQPQVPLQPVTTVPTEGGMGVLFTASQMEEKAFASLRHQEMQLLTALHLKQHEERLNALQVRQQEMLQHQEKQLEELIHRQMERQEQLDLHMRTQQERINAHIQVLLAQPVTNPVISNPPSLSVEKLSSKELKQQKTDVEQVSEENAQLEKKHLESALESLQAKHLEELQLLEDSYKRQISMLEASSERQEQRLRSENSRLEKEYQDRISQIQKEHETLIEQQHVRLAALQKEHLEELQHLREVHRQNLEEAHKQHSDVLEHLNKVRALENETLKEGSTYTRSLQSALELLSHNSQELSGLQVELSGQHNSQLDLREAALKARETELKVTRESLEKQRSASEEERRRLLELVAELEQKLAEQRQNFEEERWNLRQEASRLEAATKVTEKERKRAMEQIEKEKQQLQSMKESLLAEQRMLDEQLQQEKLSLASEKSRLDTLAKLHGSTSPDVSKLRAELEAALQVVQEASRQAEEERGKLRSQQQRLDEERRKLEDFEHELASRARELETLSKMAVATREEGRRALEEAHRIEFQNSERTSDIRRQLAELREREKRLTQEKVLLSQERLSLQHDKSRILCSYCRRPATVPMSPPLTPPDLDKRFVDPKVIIMKLAAEDESSRLDQDSYFVSSHLSASK